jgi:PAS domain S-box-containing protein
MLVIDAGGKIVLVNREIERLFGYPRAELLGESVERLVPMTSRGQHPAFRHGFFASPKTRAMGAGRDLFGVRKDGSEVPVEIGLTPVETEEGLYVVSAIVDISERKRAEAEQRRLESELRQSQKLEAVGRLAGGIAHDFNNVLAMIVGFAELARDGVGTSNTDTLRRDLSQILATADRGREIVQQLLRFSRPQPVDVRAIDLPAVIQEATGLLKAALPPGVSIRLEGPGANLPQALGDPTSIHQVVMNLATNAAHAMPDGGTITIAFQRFYARDHFLRAHPGLREGHYVMLTVRDTGKGMDAATRDMAFEPFFTTKAVGQGTGLGLAMVRGIMRDHGGAVWIESELGVGTTVQCLLPVSPDAEVGEVAARDAGPGGRGERILLIDDEVGLAEIGKRRLEAIGYHVTAISDPTLALALFRESPRLFDVVLTDYAMPGLTGLQLASSISTLRPDIPIMLLTGYLEDFPVDALAQAGIRKVSVKPLTGSELAGSIRELLDEGKAG